MNPLRVAATALFLAALGPAHAAGQHAVLPVAQDLQADAQDADRRGVPIVILFSLPDCPYCKVVRENYLAPLLRTGSPQQRPIIREAGVTTEAQLTGFGGEKLAQRELAKRYNVNFAPTVLFLDKAGKALADPIIGGDHAGLYGGYLENAFSAAAMRLQADRAAAKSTSNKGEKK